ncbi:MAG: filamentous hemagglutinin N-terminal domain-containing protein [Burkholderiales bacterium]|nr:filamentous hemagglutinin N-terminal domain-containing protein [Burkholderiales bacterium]
MTLSRSAAALAVASCFTTGSTLANPTSPTVVHGAAQITSPAANILNITTATPQTIINWGGFSINAGELTRFLQPSAVSAVLNRVTGGDPSQILGALQSNGRVFLVNPSGIVFGAGAQVDVAGLVATSLNLSNADFLANRLTFIEAPGAASVINNGHITTPQGGQVYLVGPAVANNGIITSPQGEVVLAAGNSVELVNPGTPNLRVEITATDNEAQNLGQIIAGSGRVGIYAGLINHAGMIRADSAVAEGGRILLKATKNATLDAGSTINASGTTGGSIDIAADGAVVAGGRIETRGTDGDGGNIAVTGGFVALGGTVSADGARGGGINVASAGTLSLAENVSARGLADAGGSISYRSGGGIIETRTSRSDASGATDGGAIRVDAAGGLLSSGSYIVEGATGAGGLIDLSGGSVRLLSAQVDASGAAQGGRVRIGGAFQGGKAPDSTAPYYQSFAGRWTDSTPIANAQATLVNDGSRIDVSSSQGAGGTAVVWSEQQTTLLGAIDARGAAGGGSVEISSKDTLRHASLANVQAGPGGHLLLDPTNIVIGDVAAISAWNLAAIMGSGYTGTPSTDIGIALDANGGFGAGVSLNAAGDRLAVGVADFFAASPSPGTVRLFSFTDSNFSGGALTGTIGSGYTGGNNVNFTTGANDSFGWSLSLNAAGDRLAVGEPGNVFTAAPGRVRLFSFTDGDFSGGSLTGTIGSGFTGPKDFDFSTVPLGSASGRLWLGDAVALNAAGDRLVTTGTVFGSAREVHMLTFSDGDFSGAQVAGTIGPGQTGGKNINLTMLTGTSGISAGVALNTVGDRLAVTHPLAGRVELFSFTDNAFSGGVRTGTLNVGGASRAVALNAAGDRLAVGLYPTNGDAGSVHIYSFADGNFSGAALANVLGEGSPASVSPEAGDRFGSAVAFNAAGDRLVVGAPGDDGAGNAAADSGSVYLFTSLTASGPQPAQSYAYADANGQTVSIRRSDLAALLSQGTAVSLQASNDITLDGALLVANATGNGGALSLQAGRSILLNADIATDNGDLTLIANDRLANGVMNAQRASGNAVITMAPGATIDAGSGSVVMELRDGAGKTNTASGAISLNSITAGNIRAVNEGPSAGSNIVINSGATLSASGAGDALVFAAASGGDFVNNAGAGALSAPAGRWLVYSTSPAGSTENGLTAAAGSAIPRLYNRTFATNGPGTIAEPGNHLIYSFQPTLDVTADAQSRVYGDANPVFTHATSGFVTDDGVTDTLAAVLSGALATTATPASAVSGSPYAITVGTLASGSGYDINYTGADLTITTRPITVTADAGQTKVYGVADPAFTYGITTGNLVGGDMLSGGLTRMAGSNAGSYAITQGTLANSNYDITYVGNNFAITPAPLTITADNATRVVNTANPVFSASFSGFAPGENSGNLSGTLGFSTLANLASPIGSYAITPSGVSSGNYSISFVDGMLTVTAAPVPPENVAGAAQAGHRTLVADTQRVEPHIFQTGMTGVPLTQELSPCRQLSVRLFDCR